MHENRFLAVALGPAVDPFDESCTRHIEHGAMSEVPGVPGSPVRYRTKDSNHCSQVVAPREPPLLPRFCLSP